MSVVRFDDGGRDIVETLRATLAEAEAGRITCLALAAAVLLEDGTSASGGAWCPGNNPLVVLGEMRTVEARAIQWLADVNDGRL